MFKLPLSSKHQELDKFLTIDISASEIKVLLFYRQMQDQSLNQTQNIDSKDYKILGYSAKKLEPNTVRSGFITDNKMFTDKLESAIDETLKDHPNVKNVVIGVDGELALGLITTAKITRHPLKPIEQIELDELYERILETASLDAQNEYLEITANADTDLSVTTTAVIYSKLDNKTAHPQFLKSPENFIAETIEQAIYTSFTPTYHLNLIAKTLKKLKMNLLLVGSNMYGVLLALKKTTLQTNDAILLNIDNDYTGVAIVFGGGIVATRTLNLGAIHFAKQLSEKMGLTFEEATKVLDSYNQKKLSESERNVIRKCLNGVLTLWLEGLTILFNEFNGVKTFPETVYVFGEGLALNETFEILNMQDWTKEIPFKDKPIFTKVGISDLVHFGDMTGNIVSNSWFKLTCLPLLHMEMQNDQT